MLELSKTKGEESATIFNELGAVYTKLLMWDKAAENYEVALRMRRRRNDLRMELGKSYAKLGRTAEAERKFREVLAFSPDDADAWRELQLLGKAY